MTPTQANSIGLACAAISLAFAVHLAGLFGIIKASSGSGFWSFLFYIVALILGFLLPTHFRQTQAISEKAPTQSGLNIAIPMIAAWILLKTEWGETFLLSVIVPNIAYGWLFPPMFLAGFSVTRMLTQEKPI